MQLSTNSITKRTLVLWFLLLVCIFSAKPQSDGSPKFSYNGNEFGEGIDKFIARHGSIQLYVTNYLSKHHPKLHDKCIEGLLLVRFKFGTTGDIAAIECSKQVDVELTESVMAAIGQSEKYWIEKDRWLNKWIVLPVIYEYGTSCLTRTKEMKVPGGNPFEFGDSKPETFESLNLQPLMISSGVNDE